MLSYSVNGETGLGSLLLVTVVLPAEESSILPARSSGPQVDHDLQCRSWIIVSEPPTALLIVDVQVGLVALMSASVRDGVLPKIKALLTEARTSGISVIYIQHDGAAGHPLEDPHRGLGNLSSIKPADGECVIRKREPDSFFGTTLQQELEKRGIAHLIVAGGMTEYCVDTTQSGGRRERDRRSFLLPTPSTAV